MPEEVGCRRRDNLEDYPLAKYGGWQWRRPRNEREGALSLQDHIRRDRERSKHLLVNSQGRSLPRAELTDFQKERRLFHRLRAEKVERGEGQVTDANGSARSGQAQNGRTFGGDSRV